MKIIRIIPDILYSVKYEDQELDEYQRFFAEHQDFNKVLAFFQKHCYEINDYYVKTTGISRDDPFKYAQKIVEESIELFERLELLIDNIIHGKEPDFHTDFKWLEGTSLEPIAGLKWRCIRSDSMLRLYAAEINRNCLIIVFGGIKIRKTLSECPGLRDAAKKVQGLISFLNSNNILESDDIEDLIDEE